MKILTPSTLAILLTCCLAAPCLAQQPPVESGSAAGRSSTAERPKQDMKGINRAVRAIGKFLKSPDGAQPPMGEVATLQQVVMAAKFKLPPEVAKKPEAEQAAALKAYRKQMNSLIRQTLDLEEALEGKDWDQAGKVLSAMNDLKKVGHRDFKGRSRRR